MEENHLEKNNVLLFSTTTTDREFHYMKDNFLGRAVNLVEASSCSLLPEHGGQVYFAGDFSAFPSDFPLPVNIIKEFSTNYETAGPEHKVITYGRVPISVFDVGLFVRDCYDSAHDYFGALSTEHAFQSLTESTKPGIAFRKGIYITKVQEVEEGIRFNLLRCSSNFTGPSDNVRSTDDLVMSEANHIAERNFAQKTDLNHVLAQIYENHRNEHDVEKKAVIKQHSDKTKDMPRNGLMAFCTFYESYHDGAFHDPRLQNVHRAAHDHFDWVYKNSSVLTCLRFRLKKDVTDPHLTKHFDVPLYPNSIFLMSLDMNRMYTHEIVPSTLGIDLLPIRMGYVIRCSKTEAIHRHDGVTVLNVGEGFRPMEPAAREGVSAVKELYLKENLTSEMVHYSPVYFSMNKGDYEKPFV